MRHELEEDIETLASKYTSSDYSPDELDRELAELLKNFAHDTKSNTNLRGDEGGVDRATPAIQSHRGDEEETHQPNVVNRSIIDQPEKMFKTNINSTHDTGKEEATSGALKPSANGEPWPGHPVVSIRRKKIGPRIVIMVDVYEDGLSDTPTNGTSSKEPSIKGVNFDRICNVIIF
jgi:hypothetical protein